MDKLSPHFTRDELACRCCGSLLINQKLLDLLEDIRAAIGQPLHITSGYRCRKHNAEVGGVENSYHCIGQAADVYADGVSLEAIAKAAAEAGAGGIGIYPEAGFVHVDVRRSNPPTEWTTSRQPIA